MTAETLVNRITTQEWENSENLMNDCLIVLGDAGFIVAVKVPHDNGVIEELIILGRS